MRAAYLGLVERKGDTKQVAQIVTETSLWLNDHSQDIHVRERYLGLVERKGSSEQVAHIITETKEWLVHNHTAKEVWGALIALLIRANLLEEAMTTARQAISLHPKHDKIASNFLRLFGGVTDEKIAREMYESLIAGYPKNPNFAVGYANWLGKHDYFYEAKAIYDSLVKRFSRWHKISLLVRLVSRIRAMFARIHRMPFRSHDAS